MRQLGVDQAGAQVVKLGAPGAVVDQRPRQPRGPCALGVVENVHEHAGLVQLVARAAREVPLVDVPQHDSSTMKFRKFQARRHVGSCVSSYR
eukprot:6905414-Prymnesium_polylepis.1